ncbi:hypothetical protein NQ317_012978 [Molorchus minor]|uniref:Uncharacterized protein n=1 Tax=Molorchus minor TaxID=1323400 RepID=A0ABQ9JGY4_9CUCU|nr:hypothetical protein NQ317_012978 [Molorchus minor]
MKKRGNLMCPGSRYKAGDKKAYISQNKRASRVVQTIAYNSHKWVNIPILKVWDDGYFETH